MRKAVNWNKQLNLQNSCELRSEFQFNFLVLDESTGRHHNIGSLDNFAGY
jgi:hypothetical protein